MLDSGAEVVLDDRLLGQLREALPFIRNKAFKRAIRDALDKRCILYNELKRISNMLKDDKRTKDLKLAMFDLEGAIFSFPKHTSQEDAIRKYEEKEYNRMLGKKLEYEEDEKYLMSVTPYMNLLLTMVGCSIGVYCILRYLMLASLESSLLWAITSGFVFSVIDLILKLR